MINVWKIKFFFLATKIAKYTAWKNSIRFRKRLKLRYLMVSWGALPYLEKYKYMVQIVVKTCS